MSFVRLSFVSAWLLQCVVSVAFRLLGKPLFNANFAFPAAKMPHPTPSAVGEDTSDDLHMLTGW